MQPLRFDQIFANYSMTDPTNETVFRLNRDLFTQIEITNILAKEGLHRFINLAEGGQAQISLALYAGDGIVVKITPSSSLPVDPLPRVLFPFAKSLVTESEKAGRFVIEKFPCLSVSKSMQDVADVRADLAKHHLVFASQDDRPNNIGRLADGSLAVLDGDAVRHAPEMGRNSLSAALRDWQTHVSKVYPDLYSGTYLYSQSDKTDFRVRPYKSIPTINIDLEKPSGAMRPHWFHKPPRPAAPSGDRA